jgi:hypothetical protein
LEKEGQRRYKPRAINKESGITRGRARREEGVWKVKDEASGAAIVQIMINKDRPEYLAREKQPTTSKGSPIIKN